VSAQRQAATPHVFERLGRGPPAFADADAIDGGRKDRERLASGAGPQATRLELGAVKEFFGVLGTEVRSLPPAGLQSADVVQHEIQEAADGRGGRLVGVEGDEGGPELIGRAESRWSDLRQTVERGRLEQVAAVPQARPRVIQGYRVAEVHAAPPGRRISTEMG